MKYVFIVNPTSGKGDCSLTIKRISEYCISNNIEFEIEITKEPKDATKLCKKHKRDGCIIFAVGGDGTLNECVNGVVGTKNKLGLIPVGSGNDFYKTITKYNEKEKVIDLGKVNDMYFINVCSIGIDAEVGMEAIRLKEKGVNPKNIYNAAIVSTFIKYQNKKMMIETKNSINLSKFSMLSICNGSYYGGGYYIGPKIDLSDGMFDVYIVRSVPKLWIPVLLPKLKNGTHEDSVYVERQVLDNIHLKSKKDLVCCVDGEIIKEKKFVFKTVKHALTFYQDRELIDYVLNGLHD